MTGYKAAVVALILSLTADLRAVRKEMVRLAERLVAEGHWHEDTLEEWKKEWGLS